MGLSDLWRSFDRRLGLDLLVAFFCFFPQIDSDREVDHVVEFADSGDMTLLIHA